MPFCDQFHFLFYLTQHYSVTERPAEAETQSSQSMPVGSPLNLMDSSDDGDGGRLGLTVLGSTDSRYLHRSYNAAVAGEYTVCLARCSGYLVPAGGP